MFLESRRVLILAFSRVINENKIQVPQHQRRAANLPNLQDPKLCSDASAGICSLGA